MTRYTSQQQQEDRSRHQLGERFSEVGWVLDGISRDLGEDLSGRIYERGESTGLKFDIQLKSTNDIESHRLKSNNDVSYPLEVKDLIHWEVSTVPVVVILWDVNQRMGYWVLASTIVKKLDEEKPTWRDGQKAVSVWFPSDHTTDDKGLVILRMHLVKEGQDSIARWFMRNFTVSVPDAPESRADLEAFLHNQATGERITIENALAILATGRDFRSGSQVKIPLNKKSLQASPRLMERMLADLERSSGYISIKTELQEHKVQLLGEEISFGLCVGMITGRIPLAMSELRKKISSGSPDEKLEVELVNAYSIVESQSILKALSKQ